MLADRARDIAALTEFDLADLLVRHWNDLRFVLAKGDDEEVDRRLDAWRAALDHDHCGEGDRADSRLRRCLHLQGFLQGELRPASVSQFRRQMEECLAHPLSRLGLAIDAGRTVDVENWRWAGAAYASALLAFLHEERASLIAERRRASSAVRVPVLDRVRRRYPVARKLRTYGMDRAKRAKSSRLKLWNLLRAESVSRFLAAEDERWQQYHVRVTELRAEAQAMVPALIIAPLPASATIEQQVQYYESEIERARLAQVSDSGVTQALQGLLDECDALLKHAHAPYTGPTSDTTAESTQGAGDPGAPSKPGNIDSATYLRRALNSKQLRLPGMPLKEDQFRIPGMFPEDE